MLVNGVEVTRSNLPDLGLPTLRVTQGTLAHNVGQGWGDVTEEKLLIEMEVLKIQQIK